MTGFRVGTINDKVTRQFAQSLSDNLRPAQVTVVDNREGQDSDLASRFVAAASPDGYTILVGTVRNTLRMANPAPEPGYNLLTDFSSIGKIAVSPIVAIASPDSTIALTDILARARSIPTGQSPTIVVSDEVATVPHHYARQFEAGNGGSYSSYSYQVDAAPGLLIVASARNGQAFGLFPLTSMVDWLGAVRAVALSSPVAGAPSVAGVPTFASQAVVAPRPESWLGLFVPGCTPANIVAKLHAATVTISQQQQYADALAPLGLRPEASSTPDAFAVELAEEIAGWRTGWAGGPSVDPLPLPAPVPLPPPEDIGSDPGAGRDPGTEPEYALARSRNCFACHALDRRLIGPSFSQIATRYRGATAPISDTLAGKIREGGVGVWGRIPMPSNPAVSVAESQDLGRWILTF